MVEQPCFRKSRRRLGAGSCPDAADGPQHYRLLGSTANEVGWISLSILAWGYRRPSSPPDGRRRAPVLACTVISSASSRAASHACYRCRKLRGVVMQSHDDVRSALTSSYPPLNAPAAIFFISVSAKGRGVGHGETNVPCCRQGNCVLSLASPCRLDWSAETLLSFGPSFLPEDIAARGLNG